ncbi:MAG TPA: toll/interleukin-1 receptor domain-containing protein [Opitutaceae bacterium]|nr:toll/interleukin-1 receptor domain-containing protein [Opitutaceae bacterium]
MPSAGESEPTPSKPSVFLSYASEDRVAATSIRDFMAAAGLDVWYDANELGGGDVWDKKIRQQIRECDYFVAVISAQTEGRHEGYFRREWRLAVERTLDMADDHAFLLPIVIDGTDQAVARVPEKFLAVQWLKVPGGVQNPGLAALCTRLVSGTMFEKPAPRRAPAARVAASSAPFPPEAQGTPPVVLPPFPAEEPGKKMRFLVHIAVWAGKSAWISFKRLPRWLRSIIVLWLCLALLTKGCSSDKVTTQHVTPETAERLKEVAEKYQGSAKAADVGKLGAEIAKEFTKDVGDNSGDSKPILVVPFGVPAAGTPEAKFADSTFAILYGRLAISHKESVGLGKEKLPTLDSNVAAERGKADHATYVVFGGIENPGPSATLRIAVVKVADGSVVSDNSYSVSGSDSSTIAAEVESKVPAVDDN